MPETEPKSIKDLNEVWKDAEACDKDLRSEQRTNIQLVAGDHYNRQGSRYWNRIRESKKLSPETRLRITKNHIGKITKLYRNAIQQHSPGVAIVPKNETEIQDQKAAEQHHAVWQDIKSRHKVNKKIRTWIKDFVEIGEVACKVFWDPDAGTQIGWEPELDEMGQPLMSQPELDPLTGAPLSQPEMVPSKRPAMSGDLVFDTILGPDLRRDQNSKDMADSPWMGLAKMVAIKDLKKKYAGDDAKIKFIQEATEDTFRVFESGNNSHKNTKDLSQVREFYYRPCADYPKGYFFITTELGILEEGELPFGFFPIIYEGFDEITTSPRHYSIIRQLRPYQIEINRAASKMAEHQVTIGDTKVFLLSGSKPGAGATKPGIRYESITGQPPVIVPGQTGDQFLPYLESQIKEMYMIADLQEELEEQPTQVEAYALLFRSLKQKKKFVIYAEKFESFLTEIAYASLQLMKKYAPPQLFVNMAGKNEQVNVKEFKGSDDLRWQIKVEPQTDDVETKFGKQLVLNNIIQYIGANLDKKDVGKFIRLSPYLSKEKMLQEFTADWDNSQNDILAMDRGEYPQPNKYEDHKYLLAAMTNRVKQPDFQFKEPKVKQVYDQKIKEHEQAISIEAQELQAAQAGMIPTSGGSVKCDYYVPDPNNPMGSKRATIPADAIQWVIKKLADQGTFMEGVKGLTQDSLSEIAAMAQQQPQMEQPGQVPPQYRSN